jgi:hypothetical protein
VPALDNPKHERFAQQLAKGKSQAEAYQEAGYAPSEPHASRLASNGKVAARVAEIQERAATRVEVSVASITASLLRIAKKGEDLAEASGLSVARAAQMDVAKLNGLVIDKSAKADVSLEELLDQLEPAGKAAAPTH